MTPALPSRVPENRRRFCRVVLAVVLAAGAACRAPQTPAPKPPPVTPAPPAKPKPRPGPAQPAPAPRPSSVEGVLERYGATVDARLGPLFARAGVPYPPTRITLLAFDVDRDGDRLGAMGYSPRYVPFVALPGADGRPSDTQQATGKGDGAWRELLGKLDAWQASGSREP